MKAKGKWKDSKIRILMQHLREFLKNDDPKQQQPNSRVGKVESDELSKKNIIIIHKWTNVKKDNKKTNENTTTIQDSLVVFLFKFYHYK